MYQIHFIALKIAVKVIYRMHLILLNMAMKIRNKFVFFCAEKSCV